MDEQRYREMVDLIRRIRHDANNPITAALGHVQLLLEDPAIPAGDARDSLRVIEGELKRLIQVLRRLQEVQYGDGSGVD